MVNPSPVSSMRHRWLREMVGPRAVRRSISVRPLTALARPFEDRLMSEGANNILLCSYRLVPAPAAVTGNRSVLAGQAIYIRAADDTPALLELLDSGCGGLEIDNR